MPASMPKDAELDQSRRDHRGAVSENRSLKAKIGQLEKDLEDEKRRAAANNTVSPIHIYSQKHLDEKVDDIVLKTGDLKKKMADKTKRVMHDYMISCENHMAQASAISESILKGLEQEKADLADEVKRTTKVGEGSSQGKATTVTRLEQR